MSLIQDMRARFSKRKDSEHRQALLRLAILSVAVTYITYHNRFSMQGLDFDSLVCQLLTIFSVFASSSILLHIYARPEINKTRRLLGVIHDVGVCTVYLYFRHEKAALFLFIYPFITIGNGFRFGERALINSIIFSTLGLSFIFLAVPYWRNLPFVSFGLMANYLMVSIYTMFLLRALRSASEKLELIATHDSLTGLPNRSLALDHLKHSLEISRKNRHSVACVYFDLDGFKQVNDTLGHGAGDFLLKEVGRRTKILLRDSDLLARLGGDEFTIVLDSVQSKADAEVICRRVIEAVENINSILGHPVSVSVSVSVGCVIVTPETLDTNATEDAVIRQADECMYLSKKSGRGRFTIIDHFLPSASAA
jgi:diguanylate cyclase (GGDEF)-like protein